MLFRLGLLMVRFRWLVIGVWLVAAAFATSDAIVVKAFGVATAIAILLDATAVMALLVPAPVHAAAAS